MYKNRQIYFRILKSYELSNLIKIHNDIDTIIQRFTIWGPKNVNEKVNWGHFRVAM